MKLLLVDDEQLALDGLKENIKALGYSFSAIYTAYSMNEAVDCMKDMQVDLIICDVEMPNGTGLELIEWVKNNKSNVISVVLSCHDEFIYAQRALRLGCIDYILKPATPDALYPVIDKAFRYWKKQHSDQRMKELGERYITSVSDNAEDKSDMAERIHEYIVSHITEEIGVGKLSQVFYMSPDYLTRCFKKRYNSTISEYIMDLRLAIAAEMLEKKEMTVTMIAAKVGYPNYTYFTKIFKKKYGVSPFRYKTKSDG